MLKVFAVLPDYIPSSIINVVAPLTYLHQHGQIEFTHALESTVTPQQIAASDVIVACRNLEPTYNPVFQLARQLAIPIVYDLDDDLFDVPETDVFSAYYRSPKRRATFEWMLKAAQLVRVHSPVLLDVVAPYNPRTHLVWAAVDWSLVPDALPPLRTQPLEIVYATSRIKNDPLFEQMREDLRAVLVQYGDRVRLNLLGLDPGDLKRFPQVVYRPFREDYQAFFREFTRYGYAIGLAPMQLDRFHQCKTDTKFRDYAAAGLAGIHTDCPLYRQGVTEGETGLLISGAPGTWADAIRHLIEHPALIEHIRSNARQLVEARNNMETVAALWQRDLDALPVRPPLLAEWRQPRWHFTRSAAPRWQRYRRIYRSTIPMHWRIRFLDFRTHLRSLFND
jgi:glycosyltransferase involved in cell wall biosynthesis